jgi:hypothetical protein
LRLRSRQPWVTPESPLYRIQWFIWTVLIRDFFLFQHELGQFLGETRRRRRNTAFPLILMAAHDCYSYEEKRITRQKPDQGC